MLQKVIRIDLGGVNSYLLKKDGKYMLIDTGGHMFMDKVFDNRREKLEGELKLHGVNNSNLDWILLTHGDNDHCANVAYIKKTYSAKVAIHKNDAYLVEHPSDDSYLRNCHYQSFLLSTIMKLLSKKIAKLMKKVNEEFHPITPDRYIDEDVQLTEFGFEGRIIHTPGHTPGSICILDDNGNLICGDLFANNKKPSIAVNAEDFILLKKSIMKLCKEQVTMVYPGHGNPFSCDSGNTLKSLIK